MSGTETEVIVSSVVANTYNSTYDHLVETVTATLATANGEYEITFPDDAGTNRLGDRYRLTLEKIES